MTFSHQPWQWLKGGSLLKTPSCVSSLRQDTWNSFSSLASQLFNRYKILCLGEILYNLFLVLLKFSLWNVNRTYFTLMRCYTVPTVSWPCHLSEGWLASLALLLVPWQDGGSSIPIASLVAKSEGGGAVWVYKTFYGCYISCSSSLHIKCLQSMEFGDAIIGVWIWGLVWMKLWYVSKSGESTILSILLRFVLPLINAEYTSLKFRPYKLVTL